jgi:threonyl-tRNA synthetase
VILTVTDRNIPFGEKLYERFAESGIRVEKDIRNEKLGLKIREAQLQKIPYMLVIGDKECEKEGLTPRLRSGENLPLMSAEDFIGMVREETEHRR